MTDDRDVLRLTLAEAEARAVGIERRLWADEMGERMEGRFVHLEADGRDIEVATREGEVGWTLILRGPRPGSLEVLGAGQVYAFRVGSGEGHALRTGGGYGEAHREGSGVGWGVRSGGGSGSAVRRGSGAGSAEVHGGRGNVFREDSGPGDAWRSGAGIDGMRGGSFRRGTGAGIGLATAGCVFEALRAGMREGGVGEEIRAELIRAEYRALAAAWYREVGALGSSVSWAGIPGLGDLAVHMAVIRDAGVLRPMERLAVGSALEKYRADRAAGVVRQRPQFVADRRVRTDLDEARERAERNAWAEGRGRQETSAVRRVSRGMSI